METGKQRGCNQRAVSDSFSKWPVKAKKEIVGFIITVNDQPEVSTTQTCCVGTHPLGDWSFAVPLVYFPSPLRDP